jgi:hypothetical protein
MQVQLEIVEDGEKGECRVQNLYLETLHLSFAAS